MPDRPLILLSPDVDKDGNDILIVGLMKPDGIEIVNTFKNYDLLLNKLLGKEETENGTT